MQTLRRAMSIGVASGLRTMSPPAVVSWAIATGRLSAPGSVTGLRDPTITTYLGLSALAEIAADKLPFTPRRTLPPILLWRMTVGAYLGGIISTSEGDGPYSGALTAAVFAALAAYGGLAARLRLTARLGIPGPFAGTVEDVLALVLALLSVRR